MSEMVNSHSLESSSSEELVTEEDHNRILVDVKSQLYARRLDNHAEIEKQDQKESEMRRDQLDALT